MKVIRKRYASARGIAGFMLLAVCVSCIVGCTSNQHKGVLPKDKLARVYAGIVYARQLYTGNSPRYKHALDSLLRANGTDTTAVRVSFSFYAKDSKALDEIYSKAMGIVDQYSKIDTAAAHDTTAVRKDTLTR